MLVIMLQDQSGSPDGITVVRYEKDEVVEMSDSLAEVFIENEWAKECEMELTPEELKKLEVEKKNAGSARENKDAGAATQNKSGVMGAIKKVITGKK